MNLVAYAITGLSVVFGLILGITGFKELNEKSEDKSTATHEKKTLVQKHVMQHNEG